MAGMPTPFPPYYHQVLSHSPAGQYRSPYTQMPLQMNTGALPMQSMTSHWNLPPPVSSTPHHSVMGINRNKVMPPNHNPMGSLKPPKAPEKPLLPYMRYSRKMWEQFKKTEGSDLKVWEVGKIIGQKWRELSENDKQPYVDEYEAEKLAYDESMRIYKNSYAYKQYLEAKRIADRQSNGSPSGNSAYSSPDYLSQYGPAPPTVIAPPRHPAGDPRLLMIQQQQEEDEEDEYVTSKQVSAARYHRNHRLMKEIFSDTMTPESHVSAVSVSRLESLKLQSKSLAQHQKKLEDEVQQLETKYINKKTQFLEDAEKFRKELKRIQDNPPTTWKKPAVQLSVKDIPESLPSAKYIKL